MKVVGPDTIIGEWNDYADEYVLLLRSLDTFTNNKYEYVVVANGVGEYFNDVIGIHGVIDLRDFLDTPPAFVIWIVGPETWDTMTSMTTCYRRTACLPRPGTRHTGLSARRMAASIR